MSTNDRSTARADAAQQSLNEYVPPAGVLRGRIVLVSGASRGIGRAVARAAADAGAAVVLLARTVRELRSLADEITAAGLPEPGLVPADLEGASVDDYATIAAAVADRYGRLDGLVLNAGMLGEMAPLASYDPVAWARVFQVNVHAQFLMIQSLLPLLERSSDASIILTASSVGRRARAYWGAYAASKFATEGMMQVLADELAEAGRVRVNSLNPGRVRTAMRAQAYPAEDPTRLPLPAQIVDPYLYLLGPDSAGITGAALNAQDPSRTAEPHR